MVATGSYLLELGRPKLTPGLRVLTYHRVADDAHDPFAVGPAGFTLQMEMVAALGAIVSLENGLSEMAKTGDDQPRIALTFDDGTIDFLREAMPILRRLCLPANLYVNPSLVGKRGYLSWNDLVLLARSGVTIGSHGLDHRSLGNLDPSELRHQVVDSRQILEDRLGQSVNSLAYPFGTVRDFNDRVKEEITRAGYLSACTSVNGVNRRDTDVMELRRTKIENGDERIFRWIVRGCLDRWAVIDRRLAFVQNRYA